jgi:hypothetical protein
MKYNIENSIGLLKYKLLRGDEHEDILLHKVFSSIRTCARGRTVQSDKLGENFEGFLGNGLYWAIVSRGSSGILQWKASRLWTR